MTNNKPENDLISLQMAPVEQEHSHTREKVPSPVTMNNLGARLILEGRHGEALRYLSISMKHARALLARHRHRRGSNSPDMSCKQVSLPVVEGQGGRHARTTTSTASTDHSSLLEQRQEQRPSSHSRRLLWFRHRAGAGTVDSSISGQQQEAGRNALETLGRLSSDACSTTTNEEEDHQLADDFANTVTATSSSHKKTMTATLMTSLLSSSYTFVYADPIVLDDEPFVCHRHRQCLMKITVTILFNMALAHHLMARSTLTMMLDDESSSSSSLPLDEERRNELQRSCRSDLKRAVTLYTLSCRIHVFERLSMNEMIAMAHLNNLGQIHSILGNTTLSNAFFEKLLSNLVLYTECYRDNEHRSSRRGRRRLAGFYRNAAQIILRGPESAPGA